MRNDALAVRVSGVAEDGRGLHEFKEVNVLVAVFPMVVARPGE